MPDHQRIVDLVHSISGEIVPFVISVEFDTRFCYLSGLQDKNAG